MSPFIRTYCIIIVCLLAIHASAQEATFQKVRCSFNHPVDEMFPFDDRKTESRNTETICMVIHIIQRASEVQISDARVQSQIDRINRDFQGLDDNLSLIPEVFHEDIAFPNFKFVLADEDPNGLPSSGIVRKETTIPNIGSRFSIDGKKAIKFNSLGGSNAWHPESCINVWVGATNDVFGETSSLELAGTEEDGIIIATDAFGIVPTPREEFLGTALGRTLTHELGHYFGLAHLWGSEQGCNTDDDGIEDTPEQEGPYLRCPLFPQVSCNSSDMFNNYMDFTNDECLLFFTNGQVQRMRDVLLDVRSSVRVSSNELSIEEDPIFEVRQSDTTLEIVHDNQASSAATVSIFNTSGQLMLKEQLNSINVHTIDTNSLPRAVYILSILDVNSRFTQTFIAGY